ncbi:MAG TPA: HD domain-containing phosphohydrolase [Rhodocyclaceae bacterium]
MDSTARAVNGHCLEHIINLSEHRDIVAAEDIVDDRGIKLWAKGQRVSRSLQEKLLRHKLVRPLEATLTVDGGVMCEQVVTACHKLIGENELLQRVCGLSTTRRLLDGFAETPLPGPLKLLLTTAKDTGLATYEHSVYCVALSAGLAGHLDISEHDGHHLLLAALMHDIGELYVNPDYIRCNTPLAPSQWKHVAAHPRVGQVLLQELTTLPGTVGMAVAEHHERLDGSGYPAQTTAGHVSRIGKMLAVADTAAAIVANQKNQPAARLALALRIVPGEFDRTVCNALTEVLDTMAVTGIADADGHCLKDLGELVERLNRSTEMAAALVQSPPSKLAAETGRYVLDGLNALSKALSATGAVEALLMEEIAQEPPIIAEIFLVSREVQWRLRNIARNIYCRADLLEDGTHLPELTPLIDALDAPAKEAKTS